MPTAILVHHAYYVLVSYMCHQNIIEITYFANGSDVIIWLLWNCCGIAASSRLGRFVNDSPRHFANFLAKAMHIGGKPRVLLIAAKHIPSGTELRYDYDGGKLPWRKVHVTFQLCQCNFGYYCSLDRSVIYINYMVSLYNVSIFCFAETV